MEAVTDPVSQPRRKRAYRSAEERRRIVEETLVPGVSVATVARAHGINANQVFGWRKLYHAGLLRPNNVSCREAVQSAVRLLPVSISAEVEHAPTRQTGFATDSTVSSAGSIELMFATTRVRITGQVDTAVLRVILESLRS